MNFELLRERFDRYTDTFRNAQGVLPEAMHLKYEHTLEVLQIAEWIAGRERFPEHDLFLARAGALFHDTARYEEVRRFHTFDDRKAGIDHGHEGVRIICKEDFLAGADPVDQLIVLSAVELHNKPVVDSGSLSPVFDRCVMITRDSDKLSILGILLRVITGKLKICDENIVKLEKPDRKGFNPDIVKAALNGGVSHYRDIHTMNDFILTLFCWSADLHFPASAEYVISRDFYPQLRKELPAEPVIDEIYEKTMERLKCLCSK